MSLEREQKARRGATPQSVMQNVGAPRNEVRASEGLWQSRRLILWVARVPLVAGVVVMEGVNHALKVKTRCV